MTQWFYALRFWWYWLRAPASARLLLSFNGVTVRAVRLSSDVILVRDASRFRGAVGFFQEK